MQAAGRKGQSVGRPAATTRSRIYAVVRRIPRGRVATYGQVAALAGLAGHARQVGYALHALPDGSTVPWQRVVNARGEISLRSVPGAGLTQRMLLEREGVRFDARGRIAFEKYRWELRGWTGASSRG
jgi:methylated-DNA-protein-cysteine methyltransferase-like protein